MKPDERLIESIQYCSDQNECVCVGCKYSEYCFYDYCDDIEALAGGNVFDAQKLAKALLPMIMGAEE